MKKLKAHIGHITLCFFEIVVGVLLLINADSFNGGIVIAAGVACMITGLFNCIRYFTTEPNLAATDKVLMKGLAQLLLGAFAAFNFPWFLKAYPIFTLLYGIALILVALWKVQLTADMLRLHCKKWYVSGITALVSGVCGVVLLCDPFDGDDMKWMFLGIALLFSAAFDVVTLIINISETKTDTTLVVSVDVDEDEEAEEEE